MICNQCTHFHKVYQQKVHSTRADEDFSISEADFSFDDYKKKSLPKHVL